MPTRASTNFWIDIVSLAVMVALTVTGGLIHFVLPPGTGHTHSLLGLGRHDFGQIHFYLAIAAVLLLALHVLLHWSWICCFAAKLVGRKAPSKKAQRIWGWSTLAGVALLLGGSLWWASSCVERVGGSPRHAGHSHDVHRPHEKQVESCPAGASINGRMSLLQAAQKCGVSVEQIKHHLSLPRDVDHHDQLGRLRRRHGFQIHDIRKLACR